MMMFFTFSHDPMLCGSNVNISVHSKKASHAHFMGKRKITTLAINQSRVFALKTEVHSITYSVRQGHPLYVGRVCFEAVV